MVREIDAGALSETTGSVLLALNALFTARVILRPSGRPITARKSPRQG
jgi:hypothetical protein